MHACLEQALLELGYPRCIPLIGVTAIAARAPVPTLALSIRTRLQLKIAQPLVKARTAAAVKYRSG